MFTKWHLRNKLCSHQFWHAFTDQSCPPFTLRCTRKLKLHHCTRHRQFQNSCYFTSSFILGRYFFKYSLTITPCYFCIPTCIMIFTVIFNCKKLYIQVVDLLIFLAISRIDNPASRYAIFACSSELKTFPRSNLVEEKLFKVLLYIFNNYNIIYW